MRVKIVEKLHKQTNRLTPELTLKKTILASAMNVGFWERWITHGINENYILQNRTRMTSLEKWTDVLQVKALEHTQLAEDFEGVGAFAEAELNYRTAGLYYDLIHWVYPVPEGDKIEWYKKCLEQFRLADSVTPDLISYHTLVADGKKHEGRVRVPQTAPHGVVVISTPIDGAKEEMFTYELDFVRAGFVVVNFDGTGQGETLLMHGHRATPTTWYKYVRELVEFTHNLFPNLPINFFGTSSGGSWAIEASRHPLVAKTAVVSPAPKIVIDENLPDYFQERLHNILEDFYTGSLPSVEDVTDISNIIVFHGAKDLMISGDELFAFYTRFSPEKRYIVYEEEGHCCNFALPEIRQRVSNWFKGADINEV
jgi:predicted alpha/beta-fold hydrolase